MKHLGIMALTCCLSLLAGCATVIDSVNEDPVTLDRTERTWGRWMDDQTIETVAKVNIMKADPTFKQQARIKVVSYNGIVLMIGQVPNQQLKSVAGTTVNDIEQVRKVYNELETGPSATLGNAEQ